jgi:tetrapyrrole methylase family protein/MazG family protein
VTGRVLAIGLGPAGADYVLPTARAVLARSPRRFVRTRRHPAVTDLEAEGIGFESFDAVYDVAPDLETAYAEIAATLVASAVEHGEVAYAVPGNPVVAERTVALLHDAATRGEIELEVVAGLSFTDLAWSRLGVDPVGGDARVVDGRDMEHAELAGSMLVAQCDSAWVLSEVKLALLEHLDPATTVTVLQRLGLPDEQVSTVALEDLDRGGVNPDHLTSLFVDAGASGAAAETVRLIQLAKRLRDPGGCPWDAEQTHRSLTRYLLEEAYEVVEAVEALPADGPVSADADAALADELGDLLYQVVFHALLAQERGAFGMAEVARGVHDKLVRRHPHVFGDVVAADSRGVMRNWEQIKKEEKGVASIVAGITPGLPSLLYTNKLFRKAASVGLDPGGLDEALARIDAARERLRANADRGSTDLEGDLAQLLAGAVLIARAGGIDAESTLRGWAASYRDRFEALERLASSRGLDLAALEPGQVAALWLEASGTRR